MKKQLLAVLIFIAAPQLHAQIITTVAGGGSGGDNAPAISAALIPVSIAFDHSGNLYVAEDVGYRIRKINSVGIITTVAGNGSGGYSGDNGPATLAQIGTPQNIIADAFGNIYFTEPEHNLIRKVDPSGIISTFAGNGIAGFSGNGGPATGASLDAPVGLAADNSGNIFIADVNNYVIRKVDHLGIISTFAGTGVAAYTGDNGPATDAGLNAFAMTIDDAGNLFFINTSVIRKINTAGIITTIAGGGSSLGDGGPATNAMLRFPWGLATDHNGNLYVADWGANRVRRINSSGIISTFAGTGYTTTGGVGGFSGDGGLAVLARLDRPTDVAVGLDGNVYIADHFNGRIRRVTIDLNSVPEIADYIGPPRVFPNPSNTAFTISLPEPIKTVQVTDAMGKVVATRNFEGSNTDIATFNEDNALPAGIYYLQVTTASGKYNDRVVVQ